jgi:FAD synthetase
LESMSNLGEDPTERARRYIATLEQTLQQHNTLNENSTVQAARIMTVSDAIHRYLKDARFYLDNGKPTTSLASIAYAEGLLDALKFLNLTKAIEPTAQ